jgi:hypothetical protein
MESTLIIRDERRIARNKKRAEKKKAKRAAQIASGQKQQATPLKNNNNNNNQQSRNGPKTKMPPVESSSMRDTSQAVSDLLECILLQTGPYTLPRPAGTYVAPHQYSWTKSLTLDSAAKLKGAFLITNDPMAVLHLGAQSGTDDVVPAGTGFSSEPGEAITYPPNSTIVLDYDMKFASGKTYKTSRLAAPGYTHWSNSDKKFVPGFKYYPGVIAGDPEPTLIFNNPSKQPGSVSFIAGYVNLNDEIVTSFTEVTPMIVVSPFNTSYDLNTNAAYAAWLAAAQDSTQSKGFFFAVGLNFTASAYESYGNHIGLDLIADLKITTPFSWSTYSLFELMGEGAVAEIQFLKANRYNVTGNHVVFSNNSAQLIKGGNIFGARLPGNSFGSLPGTPDALTALISTQSHHKMVSTQLAQGLSYSFTPEKIQDWLFERGPIDDPYGGDPQNIPYLAAVYDASAAGVDQGFPTFTFTGKLSLELLTTDPSNYFFPSHSNQPIFDAVLNSLASQNCVSENPDHIAHIKNVIRSVMTSDNIKYALRTIVSAGIKVAPFALALL